MWSKVGFITHDLFLPDWNHPTLDAAIGGWEKRGVGVITSMTAVFNAHIVSRKHLLTTKTQEPLVGAVYHNVPLYLAGSMFAGSPDDSIQLIHDLGDPRVYTSPVNAAMSPRSSTSATSSRPRPRASSRCRRSARANRPTPT
jgi:hypothetical protein